MLCKSVKNNKFWEMLVVIGIITLIFGAIAYKGVSDDTQNIAMLKGMIFGLGCTFTSIGLFKIIQNKRTPVEKLKAKEIELRDERNVQILRISYSVSNSVATVLFATMGFVFVALDYIMPAFIALGALYIQVIAFFIAHRYYNNKM